MNRCVQYQCKNYLKVITCHIWDICWFDMFLTETSKNESTKMVVAEQLMTSIAKTQFSAIHIWFLPSHIKSYVFLKILILYFIFGFFSTSLTISFFCMFLLFHILFLWRHLSPYIFPLSVPSLTAFIYKQNFSYQQFTCLVWPRVSLLSKLISSVNSILSCGYPALNFEVVGLSFLVYLYNTEEGIVYVMFSLHDFWSIFIYLCLLKGHLLGVNFTFWCTAVFFLDLIVATFSYIPSLRLVFKKLLSKWLDTRCHPTVCISVCSFKL